MAESKLYGCPVILKSFTKNIATTYSGGQTTYFDIPISSIDGYKPCTINNITGSGTAHFHYSDWYFQAGSRNVRIYAKNTDSGSRTLNSITITILYILEKFVGGG